MAYIGTTSDYFYYSVDIIPSDKKSPYIVMSASIEDIMKEKAELTAK
ncbi:MAG: hypothetical protein IKA81_07880 [Alistipes sp.]|nr:hypothetical protein [Alistipes sp.]